MAFSKGFLSILLMLSLLAAFLVLSLVDDPGMEEYDRGHRKRFRSIEGGQEIAGGKPYSGSSHPYGRAQRRGEKLKAEKGGGGRWMSDPEAKRRRRVAGYKAYGLEGRVKASLRNGLRWFKLKCSIFVHRFSSSS